MEALPLFRGLSALSREQLLRNSVLHGVAAGTVLFEQGEMPNFQHVVVSGSAHLFGRSTDGREVLEVLIDAVEAPDLIIPAAVVTGAPYLMRARVPEPSRFLLIHAETFRAAVASELALAQAVIGSLAGQFRRMVRQIKNLKLRSSTQRVGCCHPHLVQTTRNAGSRHLALREKPDRFRIGHHARKLFARTVGPTTFGPRCPRRNYRHS